MLKDAIDKSRDLSHELRPAVQYHEDFAETLRMAGRTDAGQAWTDRSRSPRQEAGRAIGCDQGRSCPRPTQELLFNVVKHAQAKEAWICLRRMGPYIGLTVRDRGRGFDPQEVRNASGFGLLTIRERLEALGGRMSVHSHPGKGSTFRIIVPDKPQNAKQRKEVARQRAAASSAVRLPSSETLPPSSVTRVLLADDQKIVREGLVSLLSEDSGIEVVGEAGDGREAVELADRLRPDVVVMDVSMPQLDGDEATRQIKAHWPQTRVVALSMHEEPIVAEKMQRAGAENVRAEDRPFRRAVRSHSRRHSRRGRIVTRLRARHVLLCRDIAVQFGEGMCLSGRSVTSSEVWI